MNIIVGIFECLRLFAFSPLSSGFCDANQLVSVLDTTYLFTVRLLCVSHFSTVAHSCYAQAAEVGLEREVQWRLSVFPTTDERICPLTQDDSQVRVCVCVCVFCLLLSCSPHHSRMCLPTHRHRVAAFVLEHVSLYSLPPADTTLPRPAGHLGWRE